jgi:hypothetical protein
MSRLLLFLPSGLPHPDKSAMPARITVIVYILICLEVGILLILLPWTSYWDDNVFLYFLTGKLHVEWAGEVLRSGYVRGAVTALGVLNVFAGIWETFRFRESVRRFSAWDSHRRDHSKHSSSESGDIPDHPTARVSPSSER